MHYKYQTEFNSPLEFYQYWNSDSTRNLISSNFKTEYGYNDFQYINQNTYNHYLNDKDFGNQNRDVGNLDRSIVNQHDVMEWMQLANIKFMQLTEADQIPFDSSDNVNAYYWKHGAHYQEPDPQFKTCQSGDCKIEYASNPKAHEIDYELFEDFLMIPQQTFFPHLQKIPLNILKSLNGASVTVEHKIKTGVAGITSSAGDTGLPLGPKIVLDYEYSFLEDHSLPPGWYSIVDGQRFDDPLTTHDNDLITFLHEHTHSVDFDININYENEFGNWWTPKIKPNSTLTNYYQFRDEYDNLFEKNQHYKNSGYVSNYAKTSPQEDFAETISWYIIRPDYCRDKAKSDSLLTQKLDFAQQFIDTDPGVIRILDDPDAFAAKMSELNLLP